jgi:hypothetical protein
MAVIESLLLIRVLLTGVKLLQSFRKTDFSFIYKSHSFYGCKIKEHVCSTCSHIRFLLYPLAYPYLGIPTLPGGSVLEIEGIKMPFHFSKKNLPGFFIPENDPCSKMKRWGRKKFEILWRSKF